MAGWAGLPDWGKAAVIGVAVTAGLAVAATTVGGGGPDEYGARDVCEQFVEDRLRAPATADFANTSITEAAGQWTVEGDVDSENGFGAKVRSHYVCVVRPADDQGDNWSLVDLTIR